MHSSVATLRTSVTRQRFEGANRCYRGKRLFFGPGHCCYRGKRLFFRRGHRCYRRCPSHLTLCHRDYWLKPRLFSRTHRPARLAPRPACGDPPTASRQVRLGRAVRCLATLGKRATARTTRRTRAAPSLAYCAERFAACKGARKQGTSEKAATRIAQSVDNTLLCLDLRERARSAAGAVSAATQPDGIIARKRCFRCGRCGRSLTEATSIAT